MNRTAIMLAAALCALLVSSALAASGSLSITPAILDHVAATGPVGSITIANTTKGSLAITVTPRPWKQLSSGRAIPDEKRTLTSEVALSAKAFSLAPGTSRIVRFTLRRTPPHGALYGSIEVVGTPPNATRKHSGIVAVYRLISSLRLGAPAAKRTVRLAVGRAAISGTGRTAAAVLAVTNRGNTIDPIAGRARLTGARGTINATIVGVRVVPGATVDLHVASRSRLARGRYTVSVSLTQGGRTVARVTRHLTVG